jgi:hypothetical protein
MKALSVTKAFVKKWKEPIAVVFSIAALATSVSTCYWDRVYVYETLQATYTSDIQYPRPDIDRIGARFAVVNAGNRHAALLEATLSIWNNHVHNHGTNYHWDPMPGQQSQTAVIKPGEIVILELNTTGYARTYFAEAPYSIRLGDSHKQVVFGVRFKVMDSKGNIYSSIYPISNFLVKHEWSGGPTDGFTFEKTPHELFKNDQQTPRKVIEYPSDIP